MAKQPDKKSDDDDEEKKKKAKVTTTYRGMRLSFRLAWRRRLLANEKFELKVQVKRSREEMEEKSEEHALIKEGKRQGRAKFAAIEPKYEMLRRETVQIIQQSRNTQLRLALMFKILKAREGGDFKMASELTQLLRELIRPQNDVKGLTGQQPKNTTNEEHQSSEQWQSQVGAIVEATDEESLQGNNDSPQQHCDGQVLNQHNSKQDDIKLPPNLMFSLVRERELGNFAEASRQTRQLFEAQARDKDECSSEGSNDPNHERSPRVSNDSGEGPWESDGSNAGSSNV